MSTQGAVDRWPSFSPGQEALCPVRKAAAFSLQLNPNDHKNIVPFLLFVRLLKVSSLPSPAFSSSIRNRRAWSEASEGGSGQSWASAEFTQPVLFSSFGWLTL